MMLLAFSEGGSGAGRVHLAADLPRSLWLMDGWTDELALRALMQLLGGEKRGRKA